MPHSFPVANQQKCKYHEHNGKAAAFYIPALKKFDKNNLGPNTRVGVANISSVQRAQKVFENPSYGYNRRSKRWHNALPVQLLVGTVPQEGYWIVRRRVFAFLSTAQCWQWMRLISFSFPEFQPLIQQLIHVLPTNRQILMFSIP